MEIYRKKDIPWRKIDNQALLVNPKASLIYPLNEVSCRIWELIDGKKGVEEIIGIISEEFETDEKAARQDVFDFIRQLEEAGLADKV